MIKCQEKIDQNIFAASWQHVRTDVGRLIWTSDIKYSLLSTEAIVNYYFKNHPGLGVFDGTWHYDIVRYCKSFIFNPIAR